MTRSAPSDATMSTLRVLHTAVTAAPSAFAICTANGPTAPDAPLISTLCPGRSFPRSRRPCSAVSPETATHAACSKLIASGFATSVDSDVHAYSANAPGVAPKTASPGLKRVTPGPTAATTPATSLPGRAIFDLRIANIKPRTRGLADINRQSGALIDA